MEPYFLLKHIHEYTVIDVRSPIEFSKGHIPTSVNIPLFSDEQRKIIGTIYKKEGKKAAIEKGVTFIQLHEIANQYKGFTKPFVIYCARGGMRSSSVAWFLKLLDYEVSSLQGGYKTFRKWVLEQFEKKYPLKVLGGYTGVGKTDIIQQLPHAIDLEEIASHRGSVFGRLDKEQPTQEHFENLLAFNLFSQNSDHIFIEDESRFIGALSIPANFYLQMIKSPIIVLQDQLQNRLEKCVAQYKNHNKEILLQAVKKIEKKLGGKTTKEVSDLIENEKYLQACALLFLYYDKRYNFSLSKRDPHTISYLDIAQKTKEEVCSILQSCKFTIGD